MYTTEQHTHVSAVTPTSILGVLFEIGLALTVQSNIDMVIKDYIPPHPGYIAHWLRPNILPYNKIFVYHHSSHHTYQIEYGRCIHVSNIVSDFNRLGIIPLLSVSKKNSIITMPMEWTVPSWVKIQNVKKKLK